MSDTTQNVQSKSYTYITDPVGGTRYVEVSDNLRVDETVLSREGLFKGFVVHSPVPRTLAGALEIYGGDEGALLDAISSKLAAQAYARALARLKSKLNESKKQGENETTKAWLNRCKADIESLKLTDNILFSIDDAISFKPGERELTPAGLLRQIGKAQSEATKLLAAGKVAEAVDKFNRVKELMERFTAVTEALAAQAAELDGEEGGDEQGN